MNIDVTTTDQDAQSLDAFCESTGYAIEGGSMTQQEWVQSKVLEWVTGIVSSGMMLLNLKTAQQAYSQAITDATAQTQLQMQQVVIESSTGPIISPPVKLPPG